MQNLPTDNLYKFLTVLGLVVAIGAGGIWLNAEADIDAQNKEFMKEMEEYAVAVHKYVADTNKIKGSSRNRVGSSPRLG